MNLNASLRRRLVWDAVAFFSLLAVAAPRATAQFLDIQSHTDTSGLGVCGAPGHRGCSTVPTCTPPDANILRDDLYHGKIQCDLPGATLAIGFSGSLPPILPLYLNGAIKPSEVFYTSTDLHFGSTTVSDQDHIRHLRIMRKFAESNTPWPAGVGFPNEPIPPPAAVITTGDNVHAGHRHELGAYRLLYEQSWIDESIKFPVLPGFGNHDLFSACDFNNCARRMFDYVGGHVAGGVSSLDEGSRNYSWDWNGAHYLQLNTWAGDTKLGDGDNGTTHASGLDWLRNDLHNNVGTTGRPVVIFQHYGVDPFSLKWWTPDNRRAFWDIVRVYNVVGMFTGHQHATGMFDFTGDEAQPNKHIDNFVGGTGGQDPCLNNGVMPACGGRGHFFAVRVREPYLDVASLEWRSRTDGSDMPGQPYFTNLDPPAYTNDYGNGKNDTRQGPAFAGGQSGCRKIISRQLIDVSDLVDGLGFVALPKDGVVTVTNRSATTIPGPLSLQLHGAGQNFVSKSFVDRCHAGTSDDPSSAFMYPDSGSAGDLPPGASLNFSPKFDDDFGAHVLVLKLVRVGRANGSDPAVLDLNGSPAKLPPDGVITVFGPALKSFGHTLAPQTATTNWISIAPDSTRFDRFGMATFRYVLNRAVFTADRAIVAESALLTVTVEGEHTATNVWANLHLRTATALRLTSSPYPQVPAGQSLIVSVAASYTPVIVDEGRSLITGTVQLNEIVNPGKANQSVNLLARGFFNNHDDYDPQPLTDTVTFRNLALAPGLHTLQAVYAGDAFYAASTSDTFALLVGTSSLKVVTFPPGLQVSVAGLQLTAPVELELPFKSTHTISAESPQSLPGSKFTFARWTDLPAGNSRQVTVDKAVTEYAALFDAQHKLTTSSNLPGGGTLVADPRSADGYYPAGSIVTVTAHANPGYVFSSLDGGNTTNPTTTVRMDGPRAVNALFSVLPTPPVQWTPPADIFYGTPLGVRELNATASIPGKFAYTPPDGTVLPAGNGQTLTVTFIPTDQQYVPTTSSTSINVRPVVAAALDIATQLQRDETNQIVLTVRLRNTGGAAIDAVLLTMAKLGTAAAIPLPQNVGTIGAGATAIVVVKFPSPGTPGATAALTLSGSYTGGSFNKVGRVVLP